MGYYYPTPVTAENFQEVWLNIDWFRLKARRLRLTCLILTWVNGLCFLALTLSGLCALLEQYRVTPFEALFALVPLAPWLRKAMDLLLLLSPGSFVLDLLALPVIALAASYLLSLPLYLLIRLLFRPKARPIPEDTPKGNASALLANARETMEIAARIRPTGWFFFPFAFFLGEFALLVLCILYSGDPAPLLQSCLTPSVPLNYMLVFLGSTGLFTAVYGFSVACVRLACRMKLPYSFVADIECYSFFASEKAGKLSYPELLARRKTRAAEKCQAALAAEQSGTFGKAAAMFLEAAHGGDAAAMEHYARHCLISDSRIPAEYWLRRCVATGEASKTAKKMLRRLQLGMQTGAAYIREPKQNKNRPS